MWKFLARKREHMVALLYSTNALFLIKVVYYACCCVLKSMRSIHARMIYVTGWVLPVKDILVLKCKNLMLYGII